MTQGRCRFLILAVLALVLAIPAGVAAQVQLAKGSLQGTVMDSTGAVVPNAKVTLSGESGVRSVESGSDGSFLFLNLEPGKYTVKVELANFKTAEVKDITVRLNERATIRVTLEPGPVTQVVEVTDTAAGVDTFTTASGGSVTSNLFVNAPVGRNITEIPYLVAGVNDSLGVGRANPSISGATGLENLYVVNGVNITNVGYGAIGTYSNVYGSLGSGVQFDFVKEVQVKTSGFEAQYGQALGGVVNMITKSGGNTLHGGGYFYAAPDQLEAERRQPNRLRFNRGTETLGSTDYDVGGEMGGYLVKDRLFWYGGFNAVWNRLRLQGPDNFRSRALVGDDILQTRTLNYSAKLNYNLTADQNHQIEASVFGDPSRTNNGFNRGLTTDFPERRRSTLDFGSRNWSIRYNAVLRPNWLINASFNWAFNEFAEGGFADIFQVQDRTEALPFSLSGQTNPVGDGLPAPTDNRGLNQTGGIGFFENNEANNRQWAVNGTNTFRVYGNHQVDYGFQLEDIEYTWFHERSGPDWAVPCTDYLGTDLTAVDSSLFNADTCGRINFGASLRLRTGGPSGFFLQQIRGAFTGREGTTESRYGAVYLQDAWQLNRWMTLKLGVRWEQQRIQGALSKYSFAGNWAPRLGIIVDPWVDRKTKLYFNFGRFFEKIPQDLAVRALSDEQQFIGLRFAVSNPVSADPAFNSTLNPGPGCGGSDTLAACLNNPANWILDAAHHVFVPDTVGLSGGVTTFAPGTQAQFQDEYVVGFEREFRGGLIVSARYLDRRIQRVLEDVSGLSVGAFNDGLHQFFVLANPNRSTDIFHNSLCNDPNESAFDEVDGLGCLGSGYVATSGEVGADGLSDGFPDPVRRYRAFEFSVEKRFTKNWQLLANWRIAKLDGNYEGLFRNDNGQTDPNISSLFDFVASSSLGDQFTPGPLPTDRRHITNVYATYLFDMGLNVGVGWRLQSGYPLDRLEAHPAYLNVGEVPTGGRGSQGRSLVTSTIDAHVDYTWKLTERLRMKAVADIFNLWNARRVAVVDTNSDTGFVSGQVPPLAPNVDFLKPTAAANAYQRPLFARFAVRLEF